MGELICDVISCCV